METEAPLWLDMAAYGQTPFAPGGYQRHLRNHESGVGAPIPGDGSWIFTRASNLLVSLVDVRLDGDFTDRILLDDSVMFQFALDGSMRLDVPGGASLQHDGFRCTMLAFRKGRLVRRLFGDMGRIRYVGVIAPIPLLVERYGLDVEALGLDFRRFRIDGAPEVRMIDYPLQRDQILAIHALLECPLAGPLRDRFLEAKLSELICLTLARLGGPETVASGRRRDELAIEAAAEILSNRLAEKFSLPGLSRRVGLNRNKVTAGFRSRYGMTPAEFVREARLARAAQLIADTSLSMCDIAASTGFTSQSSFSRSYRLRFGRSPRADRQGRQGPDRIH